jgi:hypothetical protein
MSIKPHRSRGGEERRAAMLDCWRGYAVDWRGGGGSQRADPIAHTPAAARQATSNTAPLPWALGLEIEETHKWGSKDGSARLPRKERSATAWLAKGIQRAFPRKNNATAIQKEHRMSSRTRE